MKLPRQTRDGGKLSTLPGDDALIHTGEASMSAESVRCSCGATDALVTDET